jgi:hypothetical protein
VNLPTLLIELDRGGYISGAQLDTASAQLDSAVLGPVSPTFSTDISAYFRGGSTFRGSQRELQRIEAGTATLVLDNRDGRFTPFLSSGAYFPDILPMRRIRIRATWNAVTYPIFVGFVESWPVHFPGDKDTETVVTLVDGFKMLSLAAVSGSFPSQSSGARVGAILDAVGWSVTDRTIDAGVVTVPAITLSNAGALDHLQQIAHAEGGRFFIGADGKAVFSDRTAATNPDFSTRTWADDGTGMSYRDVVLVCNDELILNDVHITRDTGVEQVATDLGSQTTYGLRSSVETGIQLSSDADVLTRAQLQTKRYAQPVQRLEQLVDNAMQHDLWEQVLPREIADYMLAIESVTATAQVSTIEGIAHAWERDGSWTVSFNLSPTVIEQAGILDDATYGLLDSTAILA